jgi:hypothetical protein
MANLVWTIDSDINQSLWHYEKNVVFLFRPCRCAKTNNIIHSSAPNPLLNQDFLPKQIFLQRSGSWWYNYPISFSIFAHERFWLPLIESWSHICSEKSLIRPSVMGKNLLKASTFGHYHRRKCPQSGFLFLDGWSNLPFNTITFLSHNVRENKIKRGTKALLIVKRPKSMYVFLQKLLIGREHENYNAVSEKSSVKRFAKHSILQ